MRFPGYLVGVAVLLFLLVTLPPSGNNLTEIALLVATIAIAALVLYSVGHGRAIGYRAVTHGPAVPDRWIRSPYRGHSAPDAPGRPLPRAPGCAAETRQR
ncbi:hypothetical protein JGU71_01200 [Antrihabitans sp. YC3-6]|uniref:Uncharacterized protein n=1 Tax=Antrihabitans stalagmiti TaxID=2799499 RepID=A0A934NLM5_9NOCA|nr:DUF6412 domain-containing protein [Antrihabitans stalagmiti]MBJ8337491.1 hypothetical protein [Antrihabitans stalagmiti]